METRKKTNTPRTLHVAVGLFLFLMLIVSVRPDCDTYRGPSGSIDCVMSPEFGEYQWSICLSNTQIKSLTSGKHYCRDHSAKFCWYQCMLLLASTKMHHVDKMCKCNPKTASLKNISGQKQECFVKNVNTCDWYKSCLNDNACSSSLQSEISLAGRFCESFVTYNNRYQDSGRRFAKAVEECLRRPLTGLLYPESTMQCAETNKMFYRDLENCFMNQRDIKISDLDDVDKARIYFTLITKFPTESIKYLQNVVNYLKNALLESEFYGGDIVRTRISVQFASDVSSSGTDAMSTSVSNAISSVKGWDTKGLVWADSGKTDQSVVTVDFVVSSKHHAVIDVST